MRTVIFLLACVSVAYLSGCYAVPLAYIQATGKVSTVLKAR